jgi:hypothetical protein
MGGGRRKLRCSGQNVKRERSGRGWRQSCCFWLLMSSRLGWGKAMCERKMIWGGTGQMDRGCSGEEDGVLSGGKELLLMDLDEKTRRR